MSGILVFFLTACSTVKQTQTTMTQHLPYPENFDWQGHRGCRGLMPENTIPAFLKALQYPVRTLELDLAVSKDGQLVISHDPWMSHHICLMPDGDTIPEANEMNLRLMDMTYEEINDYDCGSKGNERFPDQQKHPLHKPLFKDMVTAVETYALRQNRPLPYYNIEIKSDPRGYGVYMPEPGIFVDFVLEALRELKIRKRACIQSFDPNVLNDLIKKDQYVVNAFLVENEEGIEENLKKLTFKPDIYSPDYQLLTKEDVEKLHKMGIKVIPWTVNDL
ncbi:MAG: glycerophosphodiester phosphodiesterase, partial [Bacteroidetes bacterium]